MTAAIRADVVIVGGGLLGLSTAWALRGEREVLVLEAADVGHARGGSHGPTRIFRLGYADADFVAMAQRAAARWRALEAEGGVQLLYPTPQLTFGSGADAVFDALAAAGAFAHRLTAADVARRFPVFGGHGDAVLETTSAVIAADRTLAALRSVAGATVREHVPVEHVDRHRIVTANETIEANTVIVCAGPWTPTLVPSVKTTATLEHVAYVRAGPELPIFIDVTEPAVYGLPTPGSDLYKIAVHHGGPTIDPGAAFAPEPPAVETLRRATEAWFPNAELVEIDVCPYDNTTDERFVIEHRDGIFVGAGTSGHGFKFGPLLGEQLAQLVRDRP